MKIKKHIAYVETHTHAPELNKIVLKSGAKIPAPHITKINDFLGQYKKINNLSWKYYAMYSITWDLLSQWFSTTLENKNHLTKRPSHTIKLLYVI